MAATIVNPDKIPFPEAAWRKLILFPASDSDESLAKASNRGQKLKRKAHFIHEGHLSGEKGYKRKVEHAGYYRYILHRNPKRYDEYGDELDDGDVDERADAEAAEGNPYGNVKLEGEKTSMQKPMRRLLMPGIEELLMPLTSAAELSNHPSLSIPYRSPILSNIVQQTSEMIHKEKRTLWTVKHLLTKFRGDFSWIPGDYLLSSDDAALFPTETKQQGFIPSSIPVQLNGYIGTNENDRMAVTTHNASVAARGSVFLGEDVLTSNLSHGIGQHGRNPEPVTESRTDTNQKNQPSAQNSPRAITDMEGEITSKSYKKSINDFAHTRNLDQLLTVEGSAQALKETFNDSREDNIEKVGFGNGSNQATSNLPKEESGPLGSAPLVHEADPIEDIQLPTRRMRTRAQAMAVSDKTLSSHTRSPSPETSEPNCIHPLYLMPHSAVPERDFGLPSIEAEETRRILIMWVQKQEEVVRGVERLYGGLLKADLMQKMVIKWCKAEGHVGEMSDGEDWYDKEEWGLEEDLKKGQLEEEDETTNQGKKTRGRRVAQ
ncbi:hypothetical protein MMC11_008787 [Xylographa trunciseda]|nr:hypothetical protein [Xylographa trunciseda]